MGANELFRWCAGKKHARAKILGWSVWLMRPINNRVKPCPFCGHKKIALSYNGQPAVRSFMECCGCGAQGPCVGSISPTGGKLDFEKTISDWNLRHAND